MKTATGALWDRVESAGDAAAPPDRGIVAATLHGLHSYFEDVVAHGLASSSES